jgi:hypothetical protein
MVKLGPTKEEMEALGLEPLGKPFDTILREHLWSLVDETSEADNGI